jgi:hypothetical protein
MTLRRKMRRNNRTRLGRLRKPLRLRRSWSFRKRKDWKGSINDGEIGVRGLGRTTGI